MIRLYLIEGIRDPTKHEEGEPYLAPASIYGGITLRKSSKMFGAGRRLAKGEGRSGDSRLLRLGYFGSRARLGKKSRGSVSQGSVALARGRDSAKEAEGLLVKPRGNTQQKKSRVGQPRFGWRNPSEDTEAEVGKASFDFIRVDRNPKVGSVRLPTSANLCRYLFTPHHLPPPLPPPPPLSLDRSLHSSLGSRVLVAKFYWQG